MKHTLAILVMNNPGVMARIAGLYSRRGYNSSIAVVKRRTQGSPDHPGGRGEDETELEQIETALQVD